MEENLEISGEIMWWKSIVLCIFQITLVSRRAFSDREDDSVSPDLIKYVAVIKEEL